MLLQCIEVCYDRTLMMLSRLALGPIILWGLSFRCYGFSCLVQVELHAPCGIACLWMLLPLMRHCPLGTLSTSSICPRLNMVLDPVLVCISGLWVHMLWAWSLLFTHVDFLMVCWYASCVFALAAIICAFTQDVGSCLPSYVLNVLVCAVVPQPWMMRHIVSSCVNTRQLLRHDMSSCQLLCHLCPHCRLSGMLTFGHCIQLAGSLFQCWSSMLPSAFVSVDNATSLVVLMWWTCHTSCFRKISI